MSEDYLEAAALMQKIEENSTYQKILKDSLGGIMYSKSVEDYDVTELSKLMEKAGPDSFGGIMVGVYNFIL